MTAVFVIGLGVAAYGANEYSTGTEWSANNGSQVTRNDKAVTCSGSGSGFVFSDLWQGIQNDAGWIEVGTSFCDAGDPDPKWVWARKTSSGSYVELVIARDTSLSSHVFKIINTSSSGTWKIYIDGVQKVSMGAYSGYANSADVGFEVTQSRMNSTAPNTYESHLIAWWTRATSASWSGTDACSRTDSDMSGKWIVDDQWRHTLNGTWYPSSSC